MIPIRSVTYGCYYVDLEKDGRITSANDGFYEISGYTKADVEQGKVSLFDFIPKEYLETYQQYIAESYATGEAYLQHPFIKKNKTMIYVLCMGTVLPGNKGKIVITDYTDHINLLAMYNSSQTEIDTLTSTVPGGVVILQIAENKLSVLKSNDEFRKMFAVSDEKENFVLEDYLGEDNCRILEIAIRQSIKKEKSMYLEIKCDFGDDNVKWFRFHGNLYKYAMGQPIFYVTVFDITYDKRLYSEMRIQAEKFRIIAENTEELFFDYSVKEDRLTLTTSLCRYETNEDNCVEDYWKLERPKDVIHPDDYENYKMLWDRMISSPQRGTMEFRTNAYDDYYTWYKMPYVSVVDEKNQVVSVFGKLVNIQRLKSMKTKIDEDSAYITHLLETDSLTGLYNKKAFKEKVESLLCNMMSGCVYAIVYSDINKFSYVNDNFGYEAGNKTLKDFAKILLDTPTNLLGCRIYSDFFVGLYRAHTREELLKSIEDRNNNFSAVQKQKYPASDIRITSGIYFITDKEIEVNIAIDNANLARRSVKDNCTRLYGIYAQRMRTQRAYEQAIASEVHTAIRNRYLEMFLQPKFHMETRELIGAEALVRWRNIDGSYKMPFEFIPALEKVGYIDELDFFIFGEALSTLERWKKDGKRLIPVSVNFSQHHVSQPGFVSRIIEKAAEFDVDNSLLEIEITESSFSGDVHSLFEDMRQLRESGFRIDIDDFGIGYSTLSVLMKAPVDIVKIDKSFIDNLTKSKTDKDFVQNMCHLVDSVGKDIIFEGVETEEQARILCEIGYTKAQGWLFDKAIPLSEFNRRYMGYSDNEIEYA